LAGQRHRNNLSSASLLSLALVSAYLKVDSATYRKRFFSIFRIRESEVGKVNRFEVIYIVAVLGFALGMALLRISLREIIELNGAVLGFFFIYFFPVLIHFKCCYMKPHGLLEERKEEDGHGQEKYVEMIEEKYKDKNTDEGEEKEKESPKYSESADSDGKQSYDSKKGMP
jgi:hypothetical protein